MRPDPPPAGDAPRRRSPRTQVAAAIVVAGGIAAFFVGLYGRAGTASVGVALVALVIILAGIVVLVLATGSLALRRPHPAAMGLVALGLALHLYEQFANASSFSAGLLVWAMVPYALCTLLAALRPLRLAAIASVGAVFLFDLWAHHTAFVHPRGSTAALAILFAPLMTTLVVVPVVTLGMWLAVRD